MALGEVDNVMGCELIGCFLALWVVKDGEQRFFLKRQFKGIINLQGFNCSTVIQEWAAVHSLPGKLG